MRQLLANERGMTLVEVLVALPIAAMIVAGTAGIYYQVAITRVEVENNLAANAELQRAGAWFSLDAVQAHVVVDNNYDDDDTVQIAVDQIGGVAGTEVFSLQWTDWNNDVVQVFYSLVTIPGSSLKEMYRTVMVNAVVSTSHLAGEHIDDSLDPATTLDRTRFEWTGENKETVRFVATATSGEESVTRTYEVRPRSTV